MADPSIRERRIGIVTHSPDMRPGGGDFRLVSLQSPEELARQLYRLLREFDQEGVDTIIVEGVEERGIGVAIMDRLHRAADTKR